LRGGQGGEKIIEGREDAAKTLPLPFFVQSQTKKKQEGEKLWEFSSLSHHTNLTPPYEKKVNCGKTQKAIVKLLSFAHYLYNSEIGTR